MGKYDILKELIRQWMNIENEEMEEIKKLIGTDNVGFGLCAGASEAYKNILRDIEQLECEAVIND